MSKDSTATVAALEHTRSPLQHREVRGRDGPSRPTVRIESDLHPAGKLYELRAVDEMSEAEQRRISALHPKALKATRSRLRPVARMSRILDAAVALLLPDLEPEVLRCLGWDERNQILATWAAEQS